MTAGSAVVLVPDAGAGELGTVLGRVSGMITPGTTPAKLRLLLVGLLALFVIWGTAAALAVAAHASAAADVVGVSEPLSVDAQQIYRSLSDADATEAAAFLSGGLEPLQLRRRYQDDIARAALRLEVATAAAGNSAAGFPVRRAGGRPACLRRAGGDGAGGQPAGAAAGRRVFAAGVKPHARDIASGRS